MFEPSALIRDMTLSTVYTSQLLLAILGDMSLLSTFVTDNIVLLTLY
jgi:hypothetical protein